MKRKSYITPTINFHEISGSKDILLSSGAVPEVEDLEIDGYDFNNLFW